MTLRDFDDVTEIDEGNIPSKLVSADSHVDEPDFVWKKIPAHLRDEVPPPRALNKRPPGASDPKARLVDMDTDGVMAEVLYPSVALGYFGLSQKFQEAAFPLYNDWLAEYCHYAPKRLFGIPCLSAYDIDGAIAEMHRCHDMGLIGALIWQVPDPKLPLTSPHYDKLWAAAAELGAPINLHILTGHNYSRDRGARGIEHTRGSVIHKTNDAANTLHDFVWSGIFDRHPKLKIELVEAEIGWIPFIVQQWDWYFRRFSKPGPQHDDFAISRLPSEIFRDHVFCTFMDDLVGSRLLASWGERNCMWSSDYPHGNTTWPHSKSFISKQLGYLPPNIQRSLLSQNVIDLYRLQL